MTGDPMMVTRRRGMIALAAVLAGAPLVAMSETSAEAAPATAASAFAPVQELDNALLVAMRQGQNTPFATRYQYLTPVIERVFDLNTILQRSVGLSFAGLPPEQKATLAAAFLRYTVSSYLANFDSYNGQNFQILPDIRPVGAGQQVVKTQLLRVNKDPIELDYVVAGGPSGWRIVDVLTNGTISRVAVQRSDFRELLVRGGVPALTASLNNKVASLSGGMAA